MVSKNELRQFAVTLEQFHKKSIQIVRIKNKLDKRREKIVSDLVNNPEKADIVKLQDIYKRTIKVMNIIKKGMNDFQIKFAILEDIMKETNIISSIKNIRAKKQTAQDVMFLKFAFKKMKKSNRIIKKEFERVENHIIIEYSLIKNITKNDPRYHYLIESFIDEYKKEVKKIKKFYKKGTQDLLMKILQRLNPKGAALLIGINFVPAFGLAGAGKVVGSVVFGPQFALLTGAIFYISKYIVMGGVAYASWES
jgi:hypothetical protein